MNKKLLTALLAFTLLFSMGISATARLSHNSGSQMQTGLTPNQDTVSADQCSTPDKQAVAIAWANEDTGVLHLNISVHQYAKGDCVEFKLVNADIENDGSYADHDFDFKASLNPALSSDFHQEFNRNSTVKHIFFQMPNVDATLTLICGVPGHRAAGMENTLTVGSGSSASLSSQPAQQSHVTPNQDTVSADQCSTPDMKVVAIAWANEDTGALHLNVSHHQYSKGDCVQFQLVNADIENDGSYADHDFDFKASLNPALSSDFHQEFFRNSSVKSVFFMMPNSDATLTLICGVPGHRAAGMQNTLTVGAGAQMSSSSMSSSNTGSGTDTGNSPGFTIVIAITALSALAAVPTLRRKWNN